MKKTKQKELCGETRMYNEAIIEIRLNDVFGSLQIHEIKFRVIETAEKGRLIRVYFGCV